MKQNIQTRVEPDPFNCQIHPLIVPIGVHDNEKNVYSFIFGERQLYFKEKESMYAYLECLKDIADSLPDPEPVDKIDDEVIF